MNKAKKVRCIDCEKKREPYKVIVRQTDYSFGWCCRQCYQKFEYAEFLGEKPSPR